MVSELWFGKIICRFICHCNLETLSLPNSAKVPELHNSRILVFLKNFKYVTLKFYFFTKETFLSHFFTKCTTSIWLESSHFENLKEAQLEYKESFGVSWIKITEWSIWLENFHFGYLIGARFKCEFCFCSFWVQRKFWANVSKNYRIIHLNWKFPFWIFERRLFQMRPLFLIILSVKKVLVKFE